VCVFARVCVRKGEGESDRESVWVYVFACVCACVCVCVCEYVCFGAYVCVRVHNILFVIM
jgi:hypothetical protein